MRMLFTGPMQSSSTTAATAVSGRDSRKEW